MQPESVTVRAPGKVNLYLRVGELEDSGYHQVHTVLQAVSLYDELKATAPAVAGDITMAVEGEGAQELSTGADNLVIRAARLLAEKTGQSDGVHVAVRKAIPVAAGMAGGSADAAGTLVACDALWRTGLSRDELQELAAELGSDVPFSFHGGTALGTGRGEQLSPVLSRGSYLWVFALADGPLSTPVVYGELDRYRSELPRPKLSEPGELLRALRQSDAAALGHTLANDLQAPAIRLRPSLAPLLEAGRQRGALGAIVSGSGPTCAFLAKDEAHQADLASALAEAGLCRAVRVASGPVSGARVIDRS
jgi:4-diphosphocytidyl-2-C-methyl-D-erythritol kinase